MHDAFPTTHRTWIVETLRSALALRMPLTRRIKSAQSENGLTWRSAKMARLMGLASIVRKRAPRSMAAAARAATRAV